MIANSDIRARLGLRPIINVAGTMTTLGASIIVPQAVAAMAEIAPLWVEVADLQRAAGRAIVELTGAEAGCITACCAAAITVSVAACMTGADLAAIERLPLDTAGMRNEVVLMTGHTVDYGAPVTQSIAAAGARLRLVGGSSGAKPHQLAAALGPQTAAAVYVVSHNTVRGNLIPLPEFAAICHAAGVPVIVDAASEYDLRGFLAQGADLCLWSSHKFLGGPTGGIIAGRKDLVRAAYLQNHGIGRPMKVGKETLAGVIAALRAWEVRDHAGIRAQEGRALALWSDALAGRAGITAAILPDPTGNPLDRLRIWIAPESGFSAAGFAAALAAGDPPVILRGHTADQGFVELDPCNLHPGEAELVAARLAAVLDAPRPAGAMAAPGLGMDAALCWPD